MKRTKVSYKSIMSYLSTVFSWTLFIILISIALLLVYYFVTLQIYARKGESHKPPFSIYTIISNSMVPKIKVYDVIVNATVDDPKEIEVGDVITFKSTSPMTTGMIITHRVVEIRVINGEYQYVTKGDNNLISDQSPALYKNIIGRTIFKLPQLGRVQVFVASKFGWLMVVVLPAVYIIIKDIMKIVKISGIKKKASIANASLVQNDVREMVDLPKIDDSNQNTN